MVRSVAVAVAAVALSAAGAAAQPTDVAVSAGDGSLTVSWTDPGETTYNLYIATEPGVTVANVELLAGGRVIESVATPFTLSGLDNNRPYFLIVGEVTASGAILESDEVIGIPRGAWEQGLAGTVITSVAADPVVEGVFIAGGAGRGDGCDGADEVDGCDIYHSADNGQTWEAVTAGINRIDIRAVDIRDGTGLALSLAAGSSAEKLFISSNGRMWELILSTMPQLETFKTAHIDPNNKLVAYAANVDLQTLDMSRVIKSNTGGMAWSALNEIVGGGALNARTIKVRPGDSQVVWLGGNGDPPLAISSNAGTSFMENTAAGVTGVLDIELDPDDPDTMWIAGSTGSGPTVLFSSDGGLGFEARTAGLPDGTIFDLAYDPGGQLLFAATGDGVYGSRDLGLSWEKLGVGLDIQVAALAHGPARVLVAATGDGVFRLDLDAPPPIEVPPDAGPDAGGNGGGGGGCCQTSGGGAGSTALLALLVLIARAGRRRRRPAVQTRPAKNAGR